MTNKAPSGDIARKSINSRNHESKEDTNMTAAKKTTRKSTTKKTAAKRTRKPAAKMTPAVKEVLARSVSSAIDAALVSDQLPVKRSNAGDLTGNRQGMKARIVLEDGSVITVTAVYR